MENKIINILTETRPEFNFKEEKDNFIEKGMLDSFDIISIVSDIEEQLEVSISGDEILPENFDSIEGILKLIQKK